jgi:nitrogen-specific signal transduction histidine kinase
VGTYVESQRDGRTQHAPALEVFAGRAALVDARGGLVDANAAWRAWIGTGADDATRRAGDESVIDACRRLAAAGDRDAERILGALSAVLRGDVPAATLDYDAGDDAGDDAAHRWTELVIRTVEPVGRTVLVLLTDITDRKALEQQLEEARHALGYLASLASIGELAASLAHELSQPLAAIMSNAQAAGRLAAATHNKAQIEIAADIADQSRRAREILNRLRTSTHAGAPMRVPVLLNPIVTEAVHLVEADARYLRVTAHADLDPTLPPTLGDPAALEQVVTSLLLIAFEAAAADADAPSVSVRTRTAAIGSSIELLVRSSGRGIADDVLEALVTPLFASAREGRNLGLAIARAVVEQHGGRLGAERHPAGGGVVSVILPVERAGAERARFAMQREVP